MSYITFSVMSLFVLSVKAFQQSDYNLIFERAEAVRYNTDYFSIFKIVPFKYNRTNAAANITFSLKKDLSMNLKLEVQAYKFLSNEYREFPILFSYDFCKSITTNDFGNRKLLTVGNLTKCPPTKGDYRIYNFTPEEGRYPPYIPEGSYKVELRLFDSLTEVACANGFAIIKTKFFWKK